MLQEVTEEAETGRTPAQPGNKLLQFDLLSADSCCSMHQITAIAEPGLDSGEGHDPKLLILIINTF